MEILTVTNNGKCLCLHLHSTARLGLNKVHQHEIYIQKVTKESFITLLWAFKMFMVTQQDHARGNHNPVMGNNTTANQSIEMLTDMQL